MNRIKQLRLKNIFNYITFFLLVPFACILVALFAYTAHLTTSHEKELLHLAAKDISQSFHSSLGGISDGARQATYSNNFTYFCNSSEAKKVDKYAGAFLDECQSQLFPYSQVLGVFLYSAPCDAFYSTFHYFNSLALGQKAASALREDPAVLTESPLFFKEIDGSPYLFFTLTERYGTLAVMIDPQKDTNFSNFNAIYADTAAFSYRDTPSQQKGSFSQPLEGTSLYLVCEYHIRLSLSPGQVVLLAAILLLLLAIPASLWFLTRLVSRPLRVITQSMEVITAGDLEHRIPPLENTIDDIAAYGRGINMMLDAIRSYKEADFQSRMDATQAKLQYLQLQIRPHFYLNCMKNINSLIDLEQYAKAKSLVYALSSYISHAFSDIKGFITVREELEAIQSYVDLCRALGNEIQLDFKLSGQCMAMDCLPMSLLTFVENSIKHTKSGDCLHLSIRVETFTDHSGEKKIRFLLQDSGGGFSKEALRELERLDPSKMVYRRTHVGIANVRYRLYLGYGEDATLTLRNQGQSAVVEITTPCGQHTERRIYESFDCR